MNGVTELFVHGVGGPGAAQILDEPNPRQVAGDGTAGFFRHRRADVSRVREAYVWGGLTSRALITGLWWLLLPFTLANVAGWVVGRRDTPSAVAATNRVLITVAGIGLTVLYLLYAAVAFVDVVALRCGASTACTARWWLTPLTWFGTDGVGHPAWRAGLGCLCVLAVVGVMFSTAGRGDRPVESDDGGGGRAVRAVAAEPTGLQDPSFWTHWGTTDRLFRWHTLAATATLGIVVGVAFRGVGDSVPVPTGLRWALGATGAAVVLVVVWLATPDRFVWSPTGYRRRSPREWRRSLAVGVGTHLLALAVAGLLAWIAHGAAPTASLRTEGFIQIVAWIAYPMYGVIVVLWALAIWDDRHGFANGCRTVWAQLRHGFCAPGGDAVAGLEQAGFRFWPAPVALGLGLMLAFSGLSAVLERLIGLLDAEGALALETPLIGGNTDTFAFTFAITVMVATATLLRPSVITAAMPSVETDFQVSAADSPRKNAWVRSVARARVVAQGGRNVDVFLTLFTLLFGGIQVTRFALGGERGASSTLFGWSWLATLGSWGLVLFLFPGVMIIRAAVRGRNTRRSVGRVWDVLTFWPRRFHPLAAPCYAVRAVPEIRQRIRALAEDDGTVVVLAHSQGSVLAYAALASLSSLSDDDTTDETTDVTTLSRVAFVTMGSPLRQLFVPFFPSFFDPADFRGLATRLGHHGWHNVYRRTDYIGGGVLGDDRHGAGDEEILDPPAFPLPLSRHSRYEDEPAVERWVLRSED